MQERICPAVPEHAGGGWVTACYERVTDADTKCPKCGRPVWFMAARERLLAGQQSAAPENERKD